MDPAEKVFNFSDEELVLRAQKNEQFIELLLRRYKPLVRKIAGKYFLKGGDRDDILQEGMIGLYQAIINYRCDKNTPFQKFATICIRREIISAVRYANRQKRFWVGNYEPLDSHVKFGDEEGILSLAETIPSPEKGPLEILTEQEGWENFSLILSEKEEEVAYLFYIKGIKVYQKIANYLGIREKAVDNTLTRIKNKARKFKKFKDSSHK